MVFSLLCLLFTVNELFLQKETAYESFGIPEHFVEMHFVEDRKKFEMSRQQIKNSTQTEMCKIEMCKIQGRGSNFPQQQI